MKLAPKLHLIRRLHIRREAKDVANILQALKLRYRSFRRCRFSGSPRFELPHRAENTYKDTPIA